MFRRFFLFALFGMMLVAGVSAVAEKLVPVLCLASYDTKKQGLDYLDPIAIKEYRKMGYELKFDFYQKINPEEIFKYPIVVGMITQLHGGTNAISPTLASAIDRYLKSGGGFVLIPGPSYYAVEDFVRQLNPWLKKYGARLYSEIPYDPANTKVVNRVMDYRYLRTRNLNKKHPVLDEINQLYLPLDFSNNYVRTHTLRVSPEWTALVNGEASCITCPFRQIVKGVKKPGTYKSSPLFLAVRDWGRGRLAVFATASRYYIFDAYHWAHGSGFVMKNGGLKMMSNLFGYVSENWQGAKHVAVEKKKDIVKGNVPVMVRKKEWLNYVTSNFMPRDYSVKYYIDCGALSDIPYTGQRGWGYVDVPNTNWLIRWAWSEIFHPTAANSRAFDIKSLRYRFDGLDKSKEYKLGIMVWGYQSEGGRDVRVSGKAFNKTIQLPLFAEKQGPSFKTFTVPSEAYSTGALELAFSRGNGGKGSFSSVCEIWLWEAGGKKTTPEQIVSAFESPSGARKELLYDVKFFNGLAGAVSNNSGGMDSVADMAEAAKKAGLRFLIFSDDVKKLDQQRFKVLRNECAKATGKEFTALPGIQFNAEYKNMKRRLDNPRTYGKITAYAFGDIRNLPLGNAYGNPHELYWKFFGGEYCGGKKVAPNLKHPASNAIPPFFQRFWRGFDIFNFDRKGNKSCDSSELFVDLLSSGYGPYPRVSGAFKSAREITRAAKKWRIVIPAGNQEIMPLYSYASFITSGPQIYKYAFSFDYMRDAENGGGVLIRDNAWMLFHLGVKYSSNIKEVSLYKGTELVRRWYPNVKDFSVSEPFMATGQGEYWTHIKAVDGTESYSGRFQTLDHSYMVGMCADNQNSICNLTQSPSKFERDERELYLQHSIWHTGEAAGQLGPMRDARELVPRIIETGIIQLCKFFIPTPAVTFADGRTEDYVNSEMRIKPSGRDCNHIEYKFDFPQSTFKSKVNIYSYRPSVGGATTVLVRMKITPTRDLSLNDIKQLRVLSMALMPGLPAHWKYTALTDGKLSTGAFKSIAPGKNKSIRISQDGGIMLWPNDVGNMFVFPLDGGEMTAQMDNIKAWNGREHMELCLRPREWRKGIAFEVSYLVLLHPEKVADANALLELRKYYLDTAGYLKNIISGKLNSSDYEISVSAVKDVFSANFNPIDRRNPIPLKIIGIKPNVVCLKSVDGQIEPIASSGEDIRTVLNPTEKASKVTIGNPVITAQDFLRIEWGGVFKGGVRLHVHNPTDKAGIFNIHSNPVFEGIPQFNVNVKLPAGSSNWLWIRGSTFIREDAKTQVGDVIFANGKRYIILQGGRRILFK
jgi:hypothetical protein